MALETRKMKRAEGRFICSFVLMHSFALLVLPAFSGEASVYPAMGVGFYFHSLDAAILTPPIVDESISKQNPLYQRVIADMTRTEKGEGLFAWSDLDSTIGSLTGSGYCVILTFVDSSFQMTIAESEREKALETYLDRWLPFLREAVFRFKDKVRYFEVWDSPDGAFGKGALLDSKEYAFLLKNSAIKIRSEFSGAVVLAGAFSIKSGTWLESIYQNEAATYIDAILLKYPKGELRDEDYRSIQNMVLEYDPSSEIWLMEEWDDSVPDPSTAIRSIVAAREKESELLLFSLSGESFPGVDLKKTLLRLHQLFTPSYSKSYEEVKSIEFISPEGEEVGVRYTKYFSPEDFKIIIAYHPDGTMTSFPEKVKVRIAENDLKGAYLYDLTEDLWMSVYKFDKVAQPEKEEEVPNRKYEATLPLKGYPLFIQFKKGMATPGFDEKKEMIDVSERKVITAEEIITRHQEFRSAQDERLANYMASGRVDFHFKMGGSSGTVDVSMKNNFYWKRNEGTEWEQTEYFINGNRLRWKEIPELPLVQPEKVVVLPLDIHLDRSYSYKYTGDGRMKEFNCYVLEFAPVQDGSSRYRGKAWIDKKSYAIVRLYTVQTGLDAPVISSEESSFYEPIKGSSGFEYWLLKRLEGQQIFSAGGRNFVVLREVDFTDFRINSDAFQEKQMEAHRSDHQILKDTEKGYRYFSKNDRGERVIKEEVDTSQVFAIGGLYKDNSFENPIPLAGVNFFDYNFRKRKIQTDLFFGGILATLNVTDADFLKSRFDFGLDFVGVGIKREDRLFEMGVEIKDQNVKYLSEYLGINLGYPIANFFKVRGTLSLDYMSFSRSDETHVDLVIPSKTMVYGFGMIGELNKSGYGIQAGASFHHRSKWEAWGIPGPSGEFPDYDPEHKDFFRYFASASKEFYLPRFQKMRFEGEWMSGSDLDRFSKYNIGYFVTRVRGFGGSGIRFERGMITRGQYSFNFFKIIRFDAQIDHARIKDRKISDGYNAFTGAGLTTNFVGPWKTIIAFDYGYALRSDIEELDGSHEFLIILFKLF
ncbi:MAG: hypothetical protein AB1756_06585 [Acidobacteriota bacterium]